MPWTSMLLRCASPCFRCLGGNQSARVFEFGREVLLLGLINRSTQKRTWAAFLYHDVVIALLAGLGGAWGSVFRAVFVPDREP
jgi:hypothetical protein